MVKMILIQNEDAHPLSRKTPNGGNMIAIIILIISEHVKAIFEKYIYFSYIACLKSVQA